MRSARAARLLLLELDVSDELPMLELLPEVEGEALELVSLLEVDEPEVEPEAPMPDVLLLGVLVDEELALGVVLGVVLDDGLVLEPEAPIEPDELEEGVVEDDELEDGVEVDGEPVLALALSTLGEGLWDVPGLLESPLDVPVWAEA